MRLKTVFNHAVHALAVLSLMICGGIAQAAGERSPVQEIPFSAIEGVRIGNAQDNVAKTGVTVLCFPAGAKTGVDISGGGPVFLSRAGRW